MALYFQDYQQAITDGKQAEFIKQAIDDWKSTSIYLTAIQAELYDRNENPTIKTFQKFLYDTCGNKHLDLMSANNKIATAKFNELLTQSVQYSLANGVNYVEGKEVDTAIGKQIDTTTAQALRLAMRDGVSFTFYDGVKAFPFSVLEFVPLYDKNTGELMAGIRFYQIDSDNPLNVWLYEVNGVTQYRSEEKTGKLELIKKQTAYKLTIKGTQADGVTEVEGENFGRLPIIKLKGNMYGISFLNFVRDKIDSLDLTISGLANNIDEASFVYWVLTNSGGMNDGDLARFKQHLKNTGVAAIDTDDGGKVEQFTKDVPTEARTKYIDIMLEQIYSAWGAFDLSKISSGAINMLQINALFAVADNRASEIEYELKQYIVEMLSFQDVELFDWEIFFIRNKLSSEHQTALDDQIKTNTVMMASTELSDEEILNTLKNHTTLFSEIDVNKIITAKGEESLTVTEFENTIEGEITE